MPIPPELVAILRWHRDESGTRVPSGQACAKVTSMPQLITPTVDVHASFLAAMGEFQAEGGGGPDDNSLSGRWIIGWADRWADTAAFASFVEQLRADAMEDSPRPSGHVPSTTL